MKPHRQDRGDAEDSIHHDRGDRFGLSDVELGNPIASKCIAADARRKKGPEKRADEKHSQQRGKRGAAVRIDRTQQGNPSIRHQCPVDQDQEHSQGHRPPVSSFRGGKDVAGMALPQHVAGQSGGDTNTHDQPQRTGEDVRRISARRQGWAVGKVSRWREGSCFT